jgi:hypothetical protein
MLKEIWYWLTNKVWPITVAFIIFVLMNSNVIVGMWDEDVNGDFRWPTLLTFAGAVFTMWRVWSKDAAIKLADATNNDTVIQETIHNKNVL